MGKTITLTADDGFSLSAYLAEPEGSPRGGIVVVQEIFGVNSHIRSVADGYAADGYLAIAPALFDRAERDVELGYEQADIEEGIKIARGGALEMSNVMRDVRAAATEVGRAGKVGVVGYCWGGMVASLAAIELPDVISAAVGYYGGGVAGLVDRKPQVPLLLHFGEHDHAIPLSDVDKVRDAWPDATVHVYEDAEHGFNCDRRASFHAPSAKVARERSLAFFADNL
jgi:carboxymethylenebutenolidase